MSVSFLKKCKSVLSFLFLFFLLLAFNAPLICLCVILAVAIHECGHLCVFYLLHKKVRGIHFLTNGARMSYEGVLSYREELLVCLGGPVANLLFGLLSLCFVFLKQDFFLLFSLIHFFYALTNLAPLPGYDGANILKTLFAMKNKSALGERMIYISGFVIRVCVLFLSLYLIFYFDIAYQIFGCIFLSFLPDLSKSQSSSKV